ncbi:MAG TPA: Asp-tRNA(Asn)/Glu-tRNA(Gln) amidotransferase subunit GatA [Stenomitos sp.]
MTPTDLSAAQLADQLRTKQLTAVEAAEAAFQRIEALEPQIGAFVTLTREEALQEAAEIDRRRQAGEVLGPLSGVPMATKDNLCTRGVATTCASRMLERFVPPYDATVVAKLRAAGLVTVGKANMDEFAMGSSTENSAFQPTRNPWDPARVPGGSSGGSAAAVAAGMVPLATGTDTGGSIRQPAALCGIVGMKPTYGLVSRFGLIAFASSLDQVGPMTRDVRDNALFLQAMAGHDPQDSTSLDVSIPDYASFLTGDVKGLRIGLISELSGDGIAPEVRAAVEQAAQVLREQGALVEPVSLPTSRHGIAAYYLVATAEASSNLARYDGIKYTIRVEGDDLVDTYLKTRAAGFGSEVKRRIMLGTYALSSGYYDAYYKQAQQVRTRIREDYARAFERFDLLLSPTTPSTAFMLGEKTADPLEMYLSDIATVLANLAGIPALSLPGGFDADGLPIGLQLQGPALSEGTLYRAAYAFEQATAHHLRRPELLAART